MTRGNIILAERALHTLLCTSGGRTLANRLRYGPNAPRPHIKLRVDPKSIQQLYFRRTYGGWHIGHWRTGQLLPGDWDLSTRKFSLALKFRACRLHFIKGHHWADTRAIPYGLKQIARHGKYDGCRTETDLHARYAALDDLWEKTNAAGKLPFAASRGTNARTGILVHMSRDGELIFGNQGFHRLSIAKLAKLPEITVCLGVIHPEAVRSGAYHQRVANAAA